MKLGLPYPAHIVDRPVARRRRQGWEMIPRARLDFQACHAILISDRPHLPSTPLIPPIRPLHLARLVDEMVRSKSRPWIIRRHGVPWGADVRLWSRGAKPGHKLLHCIIPAAARVAERSLGMGFRIDEPWRYPPPPETISCPCPRSS